MNFGFRKKEHLSTLLTLKAKAKVFSVSRGVEKSMKITRNFEIEKSPTVVGNWESLNLFTAKTKKKFRQIASQEEVYSHARNCVFAIEKITLWNFNKIS